MWYMSLPDSAMLKIVCHDWFFQSARHFRTLAISAQSSWDGEPLRWATSQ
jgi:hypothetical protein